MNWRCEVGKKIIVSAGPFIQEMQIKALKSFAEAQKWRQEFATQHCYENEPWRKQAKRKFK